MINRKAGPRRRSGQARAVLVARGFLAAGVVRAGAACLGLTLPSARNLRATALRRGFFPRPPASHPDCAPRLLANPPAACNGRRPPAGRFLQTHAQARHQAALGSRRADHARPPGDQRLAQEGHAAGAPSHPVPSANRFPQSRSPPSTPEAETVGTP